MTQRTGNGEQTPEERLTYLLGLSSSLERQNRLTPHGSSLGKNTPSLLAARKEESECQRINRFLAIEESRISTMTPSETATPFGDIFPPRRGPYDIATSPVQSFLDEPNATSVGFYQAKLDIEQARQMAQDMSNVSIHESDGPHREATEEEKRERVTAELVKEIEKAQASEKARASENDVPRGDARFHALLREIGDLHDAKQSDYGRTTDPFANVRTSEDFGISPWIGCMVRGNDKMRRLQKAALGGTMTNEGVEDSLMDLAVYSLISLILYREEQGVYDVTPVCSCGNSVHCGCS